MERGFVLRSGVAAMLVVFTLIAVSALPAAQKAPNAAQEAFARGERLQQEGDLEGARQAYEAGLKLAPKRIDVLSNLGLVYSQLGQAEQAVTCFHKALEIEPQQVAVRTNLGVAYMRAGEFAHAQRELQAVVDAQPSNLAARNLLGLCLLKLNRLPEGIVQLEVVRQANPADPSLTDTLASAYIKTNQLDKAEPLVAELEKHDSAEAHFVVGSYYLAKLDHRRAIQEFTLALKGNPKLLGVRAQLAYAYFFDFKWDLSIKMCEEELGLNPNDGNAVSLLGSLYRQRGRLDEAAELLDKAIHLRPNDYEVLYQIGLLAQARKEYVEAATVLERVTRMAPEFPPAHITLVRVYGRLKRLEDVKREQAIVDRLNAERKNLPTVRDKALYDAFQTPE
jgi:protein O-GlcNAc transferase